MPTEHNNQDPYSTPATYQVKVGETMLTLNDPEPTGGFLLQQVGLNPELYYLVQIVNGQRSFAVDTNDNIDATLQGLEYLEPVSREGHYLIRVDNQRHALTTPLTTGRKLLALSGKSPDQYRLDQILPTGEGRAIGPDETVDLRKAGIERFITVLKKEETHDITIIVNGQKKVIHKKTVSYDDVVNLAYDNNPPTGPNIVFAVTYKRGVDSKPEGTLLANESVRVKGGMIFNVTSTDKS
jgi:hypothetical protein